MLRKPFQVMLTLVLVAGLVVAAAAIAAVTGGPSKPALPNSTVDRPAAETLSSRVAANFGVFRRESRGADHMPENARDGAMLGANAALARYVGETASGRRFWLVPGRDALCVAGDAGIASCGDLSADGAASYANFSANFCGADVTPGTYQFVAAFADGTSEMTVANRDGTVTRVPVRDNVAIYEGDVAAAAPTNVSWDAQDGHHVLDAPVPPGALDGCLTAPAGR